MASALVSALFSHSLTPVYHSSAAESDVSVTIEPSVALAILAQDPNTGGASSTAIDTIAMDVLPDGAGGGFTSNKSYVYASTNNATGYSLSMSDTDDVTTLVQPGVSTNIPSIATQSASLTDIELNKWGYAFGTDTAFNPVPSLANPRDLDTVYTPQTNLYPLTVGTKVDATILSGTYSDTLVFSLVANYVPQTDITFNKNANTYNTETAVQGTLVDSAGNEVTGMDLDYNKRVTLPLNTWRRPGYRFLGWSEDATATTATYADGAILEYDVINGSNTTSSSMTLYAVWQPKNFPASLSTMQAMTSEICEDVYTPTIDTITKITVNKSTGENAYFNADYIPQTTLSDTRDTNSYQVRKFPDGRCWMTQNLRLVGAKTLTPDDTDVTTNFALPAHNTSWPTDGMSARIYSHATYGGYYNYYAATAGTGMIESGAATATICPKGWTLPLNAEFYNLTMGKYGIDDDKVGPKTASLANDIIVTISAGYVGPPTAAPYWGSGNLYWWSIWAKDVIDSIAARRPAMQGLNRNDNSTAAFYVLNTGGGKDGGFNVRCLAK